MLTFDIVCEQARQVAKCPLYISQSRILLNSILSDLCETKDLAIARGLYEFDFNPGLQSNFGSGPYNLPLDYLRVSGSSGDVQYGIWWTLLGVPYPMIPCDLSEFDMQVQQAGIQSYPWLWSTDMSNAGLSGTSRYKCITSARLTSGSQTASFASIANVAVGDGVAGTGIVPGALASAVSGADVVTTGNLNATTTVLNVANLTGVVVGQFASGNGIPAGARVATISLPTTITLTAAATITAAGSAITFSGGVLTLSIAASATLAAASVFTGTCPQGYAYPPPSGAYPITCRYQKMMPPIIDFDEVPWFPNEGYLITELSGRLMAITDDTRAQEFLGNGQTGGRAERILQQYLGQSDDKRSRPQTVELDRRRFGSGFSRLRNTKTIGW